MIIEAEKRGESTENIIKWITNVSKSSIDKIWSLFQRTGSYEPKPYIGNNCKITPRQDAQILLKFKEISDITLLDMIDELKLNVSESGLSRNLKNGIVI
jgi:transposase